MLTPLRSLAAGAAAATLGVALLAAPPASADDRTHASPTTAASGTAAKARSASATNSPLATGKARLTGLSPTGNYIVVMKKDAAGFASARSQAAAAGATIKHTYSTVLQGFAAKLPAQALTALRNNPNVDYIEPDGVSRATDTQSPATWGLDRIDQRALPLTGSYTYNQYGTGVTAYIIDTGIRTDHSEFGGRAVAGYTAINDGRGAQDCGGHGTHVAGTVGGRTYGVAKNVRLIAVRVLGCDGFGSNSGIIAGIDWVTSHHPAGAPAVANMSLTGGASSALDAAVNNSVADGVSYFIAAGNNNGANACNYSPARASGGFTVGSTTSSDYRSSFSNLGSCLDIFAPGSNITSAANSSSTGVTTMSGTSMATPHVAGAAARFLQSNPSASPGTVKSWLINNATTGRVADAGTGSPNRLLYIAGGTGTDPNPTPTPTPDPTPTGCTGMGSTYSGSLSSGGKASLPSSTGFYASAGTHTGCLAGPSTADFDLYLAKWNGYQWVAVASGQTATSQERVSYYGSAGYYLWQVQSYSGSGSFTFGMNRP